MQEDGSRRLIHKLHASHGERWVVIRWEHVGPTPGEVIVLRSEAGYADSLEELFVERPTQRAIYYDTGTSCQDQDVVPGVKYYYTVYAQSPGGGWHKQGEEHAKAHEYRDEIKQVRLHQDGTLLSKLDTLRQGLFRGNAGGSF